MITFLICLALLVAAYFTYGKYLARLAGADPAADVPAYKLADGVDYVPMPRWKTFLIQLLNIAGLGPIFGAVLGAAYGPVAFVWITLGGIFFGGMHDYLSGMISLRNDGLSLPEIIGKFLGIGTKQLMRVFTVALMILVGVVFMVGPANLIATRLGMPVTLWVWIILAYYLVATLLPIDKIIGRIYPIFGAALIFMALGLLGVLFTGQYTIPELTTLRNGIADPARFPIVPTLFITIACGALSGFHATQSPLMARCIRNERECRPVFYGAMIAESIIALIWAAIAMAFFGGTTGLNEALGMHGNDAAWAVATISESTLGRIGGLLALLGVVAAPITSGDTAFRSARLIVADFLHLGQRKVLSRLWISIPIFLCGYGISMLQFDVVWRYFAWANQTLAVFTLWAITVCLFRAAKNLWLAWVPAVFMTFICLDFLCCSTQMLGLPRITGTLIAGTITIITMLYSIIYFRNHAQTRFTSDC